MRCLAPQRGSVRHDVDAGTRTSPPARSAQARPGSHARPGSPNRDGRELADHRINGTHLVGRRRAGLRWTIRTLSKVIVVGTRLSPIARLSLPSIGIGMRMTSARSNPVRRASLVAYLARRVHHKMLWLGGGTAYRIPSETSHASQPRSTEYTKRSHGTHNSGPVRPPIRAPGVMPTGNSDPPCSHVAATTHTSPFSSRVESHSAEDALQQFTGRLRDLANG
jgi:hypothetical protein